MPIKSKSKKVLKGKHMMPNGMMMSDKEMKKMMPKKNKSMMNTKADKHSSGWM